MAEMTKKGSFCHLLRRIMRSKDKVRLFSELSTSEQLEILRGSELDKERLQEIREQWLKGLIEIKKNLLKKETITSLISD